MEVDLDEVGAETDKMEVEPDRMRTWLDKIKEKDFIEELRLATKEDKNQPALLMPIKMTVWMVNMSIIFAATIMVPTYSEEKSLTTFDYYLLSALAIVVFVSIACVGKFFYPKLHPLSGIAKWKRLLSIFCHGSGIAIGGYFLGRASLSPAGKIFFERAGLLACLLLLVYGIISLCKYLEAE